jgi:sodium-dependent dicarboxylate transporter 2/3/5
MAQLDLKAGLGGAAAVIEAVLLAAVVVIPAPAGMPPQAWRVAGMALLMAIWWITEALPIAATALAPLVLFPLLGIATIGDTAAPYADPVSSCFSAASSSEQEFSALGSTG